MTKHAPSPPAAGPSHVLQRLGRLERETTRLRVLNALLLLVFGILIVGAACWSGSGRRQLTEARPQAGTLEAQKFILLDDRGNKRAELGLAPAGPHLAFSADDGELLGGVAMVRGETLLINSSDGQRAGLRLVAVGPRLNLIAGANELVWEAAIRR